MFIVRCAHKGCEAKSDFFHAMSAKGGWEETEDDFFCPLHKRKSATTEAVDKFRNFAKLVPEWPTSLLATSEVKGFNEPEDGSQERYVERRTQRPWGAHTMWWLLHNNVAHFLIGILPFKPFFKFHDWTSRKMHGL